jgi:tripartite-type tricarboxylate transporter receptor subunit TctC
MAHAQADWPNKSVTIVIPYAPGGFSDTRFRLISRKFSEKFGQPVIIDNKAGGGGVIGTAMVAKAAPVATPSVAGASRP